MESDIEGDGRKENEYLHIKRYLTNVSVFLIIMYITNSSVTQYIAMYSHQFLFIPSMIVIMKSAVLNITLSLHKNLGGQ